MSTRTVHTPRILDLQQLPTAEVLRIACQALAAGQLVIFPTETVYGAGVDATNPAAVQKLLAYKSRREGKPLSIAVTDQAMAEEYVELNDSARRLYHRFLPGPLTVVSRDLGRVAPGVASEYGTLGVRIPAYPLITELVRQLGRPITATSANASGGRRPYQVGDFWSQLSGTQQSLVDLILDAGPLPANPPSTVVDTTVATPVTFRQGQLHIDQAQSVTTASYQTRTESETQAVAQRLLLQLWPQVQSAGLVIALQGSLGAGKTVFVKGVAEFLGVTETLTSPTYVLMQEYAYQRHQARGTLYHLDLWRVEHPDQVTALELATLLGPSRILAIEWPQLGGDTLARLAADCGAVYLEVSIKDEGDHRSIQLTQTAVTPAGPAIPESTASTTQAAATPPPAAESSV